MKIQSILSVAVGMVMISSITSARIWTSNDGKTIQADLIAVNGDKITLKFKGREVKLPLTRLSKDDQKFVAEWQESSEGEKNSTLSSAPGEITLCGSTLKTGGTINTVEHPLTEEVLKEYTKANTQPSKLKIAIALPADFNPNQPQKIMWISAPINNEGERKRGNTGALRAYAKTATEAGWAAIAVDLDIGNPRRPDTDKAEDGDFAVHTQAVDLLAETWPGFKEWEFGCCGGSGGAKVSFLRVGQLLASELKVRGLFVAGCNQNLTDKAKKNIRFKKSELRKVKVWISNGTKDKISTVAHAESLQKSVKSDRYGKIRLELFEGGHVMKREEFNKALEWFSQPES